MGKNNNNEIRSVTRMIEAMSRKTAELFVKNGLVAEEEKNV